MDSVYYISMYMPWSSKLGGQIASKKKARKRSLYLVCILLTLLSFSLPFLGYNSTLFRV